ncbi:MAG: TonB-dependent receptor [Panacagrimonas sp.]
MRLLFAALLWACASLAVAQDAKPEDAVTATAVTLDPVLVTARKREEELAQVPASVVVVSGEEIRDQRLNTLGDLDRLVPNLQISDANGVPTLYIRGAGGGGRQAGFDPRAGVFVDGVYLGQPPSVNSLLLDVNRVEVLRGPQATFFGQDTVSGALSVVTQAPGAERSLDTQAVFGSDGIRQFRAAADVPLFSGRVLTRTSGYATHRDGYIENREGGGRPDETDDAGGRVRVRWLAAPQWNIDLSADKSRQRSENPTGEARSNTFGNGPTASPSPYTVDLNTEQTNVNDNQGVAATLHFDGSRFDFDSLSALRRTERHWIADFDYSPQDFVVLDYRDRFRTLSQEWRLAFGDERQRFLLGTYLFDQEAESDRVFDALSQFSAVVPFIAAGERVSTQPQIDTRSYALFGSYSRTFAEAWTLDAGLRVTRVDKELRYSQAAAPGWVTFGIANLSGHEDEIEETAWTPEAALSYALAPRATLFVRYARGSKSGGFDADVLNTVVGTPKRVKQETVNSYEIGAKTRWLQNRVGADLVLFLADYSDYQLTQFLPVGMVVQPVLSNAGKVRTYGPELSAYWIVSPRLQGRMEAAWLHAEYEEFRNGNGMGEDFSGNRLEFSPKWNASASLEYRRPAPVLAAAEFFTGITGAYRDDFFTQPSNRPRFEADPRRLLSARVGVARSAQGWEIAVFGDNLMDDRHSESLNLGSLGTLYGRYGAPRTYGVQVQWALR